MAGNKEGGLKAAVTNRQRYGDEFFARIGRIGGKISEGGGFASNPALAKEAGRRGGLASRRPKSPKPVMKKGFWDRIKGI